MSRTGTLHSTGVDPIRDDKLPIFTIGHATRSIAEFVDLLRAVNVQLVVDIRRIPRSRANPQFNSDILDGALSRRQIGYMQIAGLGGRRAKSGMPDDVNGFWDNRSFHNYADYALSDEFRMALDQLLEIASEQRTAIMCAEAVWWRCHRRIVADYLIAAGRQVFHLMDIDDIRPAGLTEGAVLCDDGLHYPRVTNV